MKKKITAEGCLVLSSTPRCSVDTTTKHNVMDNSYGSMYFPRNTDSLHFNSIPYLGSTFTLAMAANVHGMGEFGIIYIGDIVVPIDYANNWRYRLSGFGFGDTGQGIAYAQNTWNYLHLVKQSNQLFLFVNGQVACQLKINTNGLNRSFSIGGGSRSVSTHVDDIRVFDEALFTNPFDMKDYKRLLRSELYIPTFHSKNNYYIKPEE